MINLSTLENGIRVITEKVDHVESVALGIWVGTGAKCENPQQFGMSHFLEHMMFKGTRRRSAKDIADEVASVGGQINAATDREYTTYYIKVLKEFVPLAVDVLTDMLLNPVLDAAELEREKDVVVEEIHRHEDMPEESVHDILTEVTWGAHGLGHSVLGTEATVRTFTPDSLREFKERNYSPGCIVVSAAGNLDHQSIVDLVSTAMGTIPEGSKRTSLNPVGHNASRRIVNKNTEAAYFCLASPGYNEQNQKKYTLAVIDTILGGGMSSRLFQEVREKRGLAYDIGSYRVSYHEGGLFAVYGGTSVRTLGEVLGIVSDELARLRADALSEEEVQRAKTQIRCALLMSQESMGSRMGRLGKTLLDYDRYIPLDEAIERVKAVTEKDIQDVSQELFNPENLALAIIGPSGDVERVVGN